MISSLFALLPERILVANHHWVEGKALLIQDGKIHSLIHPRGLERRIEVRRMRGLALVPGLFNAHSHLEYTDLSFRKPEAPTFVEWLEAIVSWKSRRKPKDVMKGLRRGIKESLAYGTVAVGDHYSTDRFPEPLLRSPLKGVVFHESVPLCGPRSQQRWNAHRARYRKFPDAALRFGIGPQSAYTVKPPFIRKAADWSRRNEIPLSMHIAESSQEGELFCETDAPLAHWIHSKTGVRLRFRDYNVFAYLARLGLWKGNIQAVHVNLARSQDCHWLPRSRVWIVHCPRSHAYFRHPPFDLEMFLEKGYRVALGTDSVASNQDLSMWEELRTLHRCYPKIPLLTLWEMATINGAESLGIEKSGRIQPGWSADLLGIPASKTSYSTQELFRHCGKVPWLMISGRQVY